MQEGKGQGDPRVWLDKEYLGYFSFQWAKASKVIQEVRKQ